MAIASRTTVKTLLGIASTDTSQDDLIDVLIGYADAVIKGYCKQELENQSALTLYLSGSGTPTLLFPQLPLNSIASLYLDLNGNYGQTSGSFAASTLQTAGTDYMIQFDRSSSTSYSGRIRRMGGSVSTAGWPWWSSGQNDVGPSGTLAARSRPFWPGVAGCIKITANCGYASIPADLTMAANSMAIWLKRMIPLGGMMLSNESLGEFSVGYALTQLNGVPELGTLRQVLGRYRQVVL